MSDLTLIFGNKNYSSWSLRPWVFLKVFSIPFREKRIALFADTTARELELYNSDYKVPVLQDGDLLVWDSLAILEYLSEKYLGGKGLPTEEQARAVCRSVSSEMHSSFPHVRVEMPMNCRKHFPNYQLSPKALTEVGRIESLWEQCRTSYGAAGPWLFGQYSIADAMYAPVVMRFTSYDVTLNANSQAYVETVLQQPAIQEWVAAGKQEPEIIKEDEVEWQA